MATPSPIRSKNRPSEGGNENSNLGERVSALEAEHKHLATKADTQAIKTDIQALKVWVLGGVLGGMGLATMIALGALKYFLS